MDCIKQIRKQQKQERWIWVTYQMKGQKHWRWSNGSEEHELLSYKKECEKEREKRWIRRCNDSKRETKRLCFDARPKIWAGLFKKHEVRWRRDNYLQPMRVCLLSQGHVAYSHLLKVAVMPSSYLVFFEQSRPNFGPLIKTNSFCFSFWITHTTIHLILSLRASIVLQLRKETKDWSNGSKTTKLP